MGTGTALDWWSLLGLVQYASSYELNWALHATANIKPQYMSAEPTQTKEIALTAPLSSTPPLLTL